MGTRWNASLPNLIPTISGEQSSWRLRTCFENGSGGETPPELAGRRPALRSAGVLACEFGRRLAARIMEKHYSQNTLSEMLPFALGACLKTPPRIRGLGYGVPPLGGSSVVPPKGGTPNRVSKHALMPGTSLSVWSAWSWLPLSSAADHRKGASSTHSKCRTPDTPQGSIELGPFRALRFCGSSPAA